MSNLAPLFRQALRALYRSPGFTWPIVLVLGLGLGANVALHAILQTVLLRPLPVAAREELATLRLEKKGERGLENFSMPQVEEVAASVTPFAGLVPIVMDSDSTLPAGERKVPVRIPMVGAGWQSLLGLRMSLGRGFTADEEASGAPVIILGHRLWKTAFHGDPGVVGRALPIGEQNQPVTVVGIVPAGFEGLELGRREDCWMPLKALPSLAPNLPPAFFSSRDIPAFQALVRLKPGLNLAQAQASLEGLSTLHAKLHPESNSGRRYVAADPAQAERALLDRVLPQRSLLLLAAGMALFLAVVAASGLFAARAARRERELATRCALGASTGSLLGIQLLEALLLALLAAPVALGSGLVLARRFVLQPGEATSQALLLPRLDLRLLAFGVGLSLAALLVAALIPLLRVRRLDLTRVLAGQGGRGHTRQGGGWFVAAQVALSLLLLVASSMALGAFRRAAKTGYPTAHRALLSADAGEDKGLGLRVLARLRATPQITAAARGIVAPLDASGRATFSLSGGDRGETLFLPACLVGSDWFQALGVPLLQGRGFREGDGHDPVILNETLARRFFPEGGAIGRKVTNGADESHDVIGVVADHRMRVDPDFHLPMIWLSDAYLADIPTGHFWILASGSGSGHQVAARLREALREEAPSLEPDKVITLEDHVAATLHHENQSVRLLGSLGLGSLLLACFGLWAALNLQVALRGRELAIRMALGATARQLAQRVLRLGTRLLALGLISGVVLIAVLARLAASHWAGLPAVSSLDLLAAMGVLTATGLLACLIPALRAARVNPAEALRSE
ncbi:ABC transporter permease [Geothrix sp. PMB-07]|uniref:ABC transporter permease n=1 Tax=Geothrix sp. PMB-07 TaxID=3068640 RepID=UPI0027427F07|nr:ABC transporter permease [Geothrix sp. PMB-07]WLT31886.1 ABC transporter permease [Geothrix sp. PMB-07]